MLTPVAAITDEVLHSRLPPPLTKPEKYHDDGSRQQDMNCAAQPVTVTHAQRPQNSQYSAYAHQHIVSFCFWFFGFITGGTLRLGLALGYGV